MVEDYGDDDTASTAEMTELDSDEDCDSSDNESEEENRPLKGPRKILYGGDGTSMRALAGEEERALERARALAEGRRGEGSRVEAMPSTEVVKNRRRDKCVPSSARLANAAKHRVWPAPQEEILTALDPAPQEELGPAVQEDTLADERSHGGPP